MSIKVKQGVSYGSENQGQWGQRKSGNKWNGKIEFNGLTTDDKIVVSGYSVFKFVETKGVPLDFLLSSLDKDKYVVDWVEYIQTTIQHNWKLRGTMIKIENALIDVFGREQSTPIIERLEMYILYLETL